MQTRQVVFQTDELCRELIGFAVPAVLLFLFCQAFEDGMTKEELFELTKIDPWWLAQLEELHTTGGGRQHLVQFCTHRGTHPWANISLPW